MAFPIFPNLFGTVKRLCLVAVLALFALTIIGRPEPKISTAEAAEVPAAKPIEPDRVEPAASPEPQLNIVDERQWYLVNGQAHTCMLAREFRVSDFRSPFELEQYARRLGTYKRTDIVRNTDGSVITAAVVIQVGSDETVIMYFRNLTACKMLTEHWLGTAAELSEPAPAPAPAPVTKRSGPKETPTCVGNCR